MAASRALVIRPARSDEAAVMAALSRDLIEAGLGWRYTAVRIARLMREPETQALVACELEGVQGFALMQFGDEHAHLALLAVRPAQQRRGIGRSLVGWLRRSAEVAGIARIELELRADNANALAFYRRLGFVPTQIVPGYYDGIVAARRMALDLRAGSLPS